MKSLLNKCTWIIALSLLATFILLSTSCVSKEEPVNVDFTALLSQANLLFAEGKFNEAKIRYNRLYQHNGSESVLLERMGCVALYENRIEESIEFYRKSLQNTSWYNRIWPFGANVQHKLALAYYRKNDFKNAAEYFSKASGPFGIINDLSVFSKQMRQFKEMVPYRLEGPEESVIPFVQLDPLPVIPVSVNGGSPEFFLIDTGGCELVLDEEFARNSGAKIAGFFSTEYAGNKKGKTGLGKVDKISLGDFVIHDVPIHTIDCSQMSEAFAGKKISGVVGTRVLMQFLSTIDYKNSQLILRRDNDMNYFSFGSSLSDIPHKQIPFWLVDTHFIVAEGELNNLGTMLFFVDTGLAGKGFTASEELLARAGITVDWNKAVKGFGGGSGEIESVERTFAHVSLGSEDQKIEETDVPGRVIKNGVPILGTILGFRLDGLISHEFFKKNSITFDFRQMQIVVE